jgi:hypothetical protein
MPKFYLTWTHVVQAPYGKLRAGTIRETSGEGVQEV